MLTGPVFRDSDRHLALQDGAKDVAIPEEFWKIAVMIDAATGKLSSTGYVLSQGRMIRRLVESAFVYGRYKTHQVPLALIAAETRLDFGALPDADPLAGGSAEAVGLRAHPIDGPGSLVLQRQPASD